MDFNITRAEYFADFVVVPMLVLLTLMIGGLGWTLIPAAAIGLAAWTFVEYAAHRWVLHRLYRREHWQHHRWPTLFIGASPMLTFVLFAIVGGALAKTLPPLWAAGGFIGLLLGYLWYLWTHAAIHGHVRVPQWLEGYWIYSRMNAHDLHHAGIERNFGVTTGIWDRAFGTSEIFNRRG